MKKKLANEIEPSESDEIEMDEEEIQNEDKSKLLEQRTAELKDQMEQKGFTVLNRERKDSLKDPNFKINTTSGQVIPKNPSNKACFMYLSWFLEDRNKILGIAKDDGDCMYDAMVQGINALYRDGKLQLTDKQKELGLEKILAEGLDVKKLRTLLYTHMKANEQEAKKVVKNENFDEYLNKLQYTFEENDKNRSTTPMPDWGRPGVEGKYIIQHLFPIGLKVIEVSPIDEDELKDKVKNKSEIEDKDFLGPNEVVSGNDPAKPVVEIAIYPGHFMPVWDKK